MNSIKKRLIIISIIGIAFIRIGIFGVTYSFFNSFPNYNIVERGELSLCALNKGVLADMEIEEDNSEEENTSNDFTICKKDGIFYRALCKLWRFIWAIIRVIFYII